MTTWRLAGPVVCAGPDLASSGTGLGLPDGNLGVYNLVAQGQFSPTVCGTGRATGTASLTGAATSIGMSVTIDFVAGQGALSITVNGGYKTMLSGWTRTITGGSGEGVIELKPQNASCTSWLADGAFHVSLLG